MATQAVLPMMSVVPRRFLQNSMAFAESRPRVELSHA